MINNKSQYFETLVYSKAHDTWATAKEVNYLWQLLKQDMARKKITAPPAYPSSGVKSPTKVEVPTEEWQKRLRQQLADLIKDDPRNNFFLNLSKWRNDFTPKQAACIKRSHEERFRATIIAKQNAERERMQDLSTPTEEELRDPNWTPWND